MGCSRRDHTPRDATNGKKTITIGDTNICDQRYLTTGQPQSAGGVVYGTYNAPREWFATLGYKY